LVTVIQEEGGLVGKGLLSKPLGHDASVQDENGHRSRS
jgi:hypothetical protein